MRIGCEPRYRISSWVQFPRRSVRLSCKFPPLISERTYLMQRFFCTICGKVKRVQHLPGNVVNPYSELVEMRKGECASHNRIQSGRAQSSQTVQNKSVNQKSRKAS